MPTKKQIEAELALLREARARIESGKSLLICSAMAVSLSASSPAMTDHSMSDQIAAYRRLRIWISQMLNTVPRPSGFARQTLESWLLDKGYHRAYSAPRKVRATRLAWLDWMIDYTERELSALEA